MSEILNAAASRAVRKALSTTWLSRKLIRFNHYIMDTTLIGSCSPTCMHSTDSGVVILLFTIKIITQHVRPLSFNNTRCRKNCRCLKPAECRGPLNLFPILPRYTYHSVYYIIQHGEATM